jgi:hypothetical protein
MSPLAAAIELGAKGVPCFPCATNKRPTCPDGFYSAETDADALRELWAKYPGLLIGARTGAASGLAVVDIDAKHVNGIDWLKSNERRLPRTRVHGTRSGGYHLLFCHADGLNCTVSRIARGVDTRADGGYVIWWPAAGLPVVCDAPFAPWPHWLTKALKPKQQPVLKCSRVVTPGAIAGLVRFVAGIREGERNVATYWAACRAGELVAQGLIDPGFAEALIVEAATRTGIKTAEAKRTVLNGIAAGRKTLLTGGNRHAR